MDDFFEGWTIDLSGTWDLHLAPGERSEGGLSIPSGYENTVVLPGDLASQGFGAKPDVATEWTGDIVDRSWFTDDQYAPYREPQNLKVPFWLQPELHYLGSAWYRKTVSLPPEAVGKRLRLFLERPHWETRLWFDGRFVGSNDSLSVPHEYDLGLVSVAGLHRFDLRVDNRRIVNIGSNSHSVSDHTQGNWNGVVGALRLDVGPAVWIERVDLFPSVKRKSVLVAVTVGNALGEPVVGRISVGAEPWSGKDAGGLLNCEVPPGFSSWSLEGRFPQDTGLWDEFSPSLVQQVVEVFVGTSPGDRPWDTRTIRTGLREVSTSGTQITLNGRPLFLRGTLDCCVFPLTGYPPMDRESWRVYLEQIRAYGLNHVRFHSWCPPDAAFDVADELGLYLQIECSSWANFEARVGEDISFDAWLFRESERIVARYGNHPSFLMLAYGNEPAGRTEDFLGLWVSSWRGRDARRLYTSAAGWPAIEENDYHLMPEPRIQGWGQGLQSRINAAPPETRTDYRDWVRRYSQPIVSHEIGQWCAFPDFDEIPRYTGRLKAKNFEIFKELLIKNHMGDLARDFLFASGKLQVACYKEEIESALRTPGFGGFQLLGLLDFPGQGTALVGVVNALGEPKGYVNSAEFGEFCAPTVPLCRMDKRYWRRTEVFKADLEVAHFGPGALDAARALWELKGSDGRTLASGDLPGLSIPSGGLSPLGSLELPLDHLEAACRCELSLSLETPGPKGPRIQGRNRWDFWVFPGALAAPSPQAVQFRSSLGQEVAEILDRGGDVLLSLPPESVDTQELLGFSSVFWNTSWTQGADNQWPGGQPPHTLGLLIDADHPAFSRFPTRTYSDWLWWELVRRSAAMVLDDFPESLRPIVQPIDTWFRGHRLGLLFEARVGSGRILVSSLDLDSDLDRRLVARQLRNSLLRYMGSDRFKPRVEVAFSALSGLVKQ